MVDKFLGFECKEELFDKKIGDVNYWGFIRTGIYLKILGKTGASNYEKLEEIGTSKDNFKILINCIFRNPLIFARKRSILFFQTHRQEKNSDGLDECIFTGEISKDFEKDSYLASLPYRGKAVCATKGRDTIYLDYIIYFNKIYRRYLELKNRRLTSEIIAFARELNEKVVKEFGVDLGEKDLIIELKYNYYSFIGMRKMFRRLLKKIAPNLIVEICGYGNIPMIINDVAKELGIKTIELQHGIISRNHLGYNYPEKKEHSFFPDEIFLFSEYWKANARFPVEQNKLIATGAPYIERNIKKYKGKSEKKQGINIIVLSQPVDMDRLTSMILSFIDQLNDLNVKYNLVYKLHPSEYQTKNETYDLIESYPEVTMIRDDKLSLYYYFALADIQVGMYSTGIYEGLAFGLPTYLLNTKLTRMHMKDLYTRRYAKLFEDGEELASLILDLKPEEKKEELNVFFSEGAKERIVSEIKKRVM